SVAALHDKYDGVVTDHVTSFGMQQVAGLKEEDTINMVGVDVQRTRLPGVTKHLDDTGKIEVRKAAAERRFGIAQHLRWLETVGVAPQEGLHVRGDGFRANATIDKVIA